MAARPLNPILRRLAPRHITTTEIVGRAMIEVALNGYSKRILYSDDMNTLAEGV